MKLFEKLNKKCFLIVIITIVLFLLVSCERYITEVYDIAETTLEEKNDKADYKYIINTNSCKVHTYEHGIKIIENTNNIVKTNDTLESILRDEKYDICHTCYAGILVDNKIKKYDIDCIEKYIRLYDFVQIPIDRAEFLMSIFTVGDWYVNNVYTYQGGKDTVLVVENNAKKYASDNAYDKWTNYKKMYSKIYEINDNKKILPVVYDNKNKPTNLALYKCDLFQGKYAKGDNKYTKTGKQTLKTYDGEIIEKGYKNDYVVDDCSKFATAVYYHYINNTILKDSLDKDGYGIDLWTTGSQSFARNDSVIVEKLLDTKKFIIRNIEKINTIDTEIEIGDLIYRKEKAHYETIKGIKTKVTEVSGHVEFYIGNDKFIGWGKIQKEYGIKKNFIKKEEGYYSDYINDYNQPYTAIVKFVGGENEE